MLVNSALSVKRGDVVAFTGAGGKTSAMLQLGYELSSQNWRVLSTTTTHIAEKELDYFPCVVRWDRDLLIRQRKLADLLDEHQFVFVYRGIKKGRAVGVPSRIIRRVVDSINSDVLLVEADGSRRMPLKAPKSNEPTLPSDTTLAVPVAGLDALGQPFNERNVYNIKAVIERYGFAKDDPILPSWLGQIVRDEILGLKDIPESARIVALLNKTKSSQMSLNPSRKAARIILRESRIDSVAIGAVKNRNNPIAEVHQRIGAIVLAGGLSRRMGRSKMLLPWGNQTVIETVARRLIPFNFSDAVVVTGYKTGQVESLLSRMPVRTIFNPHFAAGEMLSSFKVGLNALHDDIGACMIFMGDQPQVKPSTITALLRAYSETNADIVAPTFKGQRGHPVLISRRYFKELLDLPHGKAPRDVIDNYPIHEIELDDSTIVRDIDTPEQYLQERRWAGFD